MHDVLRTRHLGRSEEEQTCITREWNALATWHRAHPTSADVVIGAKMDLGDWKLPTTPALTWSEMWSKLDLLAAKTNSGVYSVAPCNTSQYTPIDAAVEASRRSFLVPNREALAHGRSAAVCNVVTHFQDTVQQSVGVPWLLIKMWDRLS